MTGHALVNFTVQPHLLYSIDMSTVVEWRNANLMID